MSARTVSYFATIQKLWAWTVEKQAMNKVSLQDVIEVARDIVGRSL